MAYEVTITGKANKALQALPKKEQVVLLSKIIMLRDDPRPVGSKKLKGASNTFRIRQGDYRAIYTVDDGVKVVKVERVGHRREVYD